MLFQVLHQGKHSLHHEHFCAHSECSGEILDELGAHGRVRGEEQIGLDDEVSVFVQVASARAAFRYPSPNLASDLMCSAAGHMVQTMFFKKMFVSC